MARVLGTLGPHLALAGAIMLGSVASGAQQRQGGKRPPPPPPKPVLAVTCYPDRIEIPGEGNTPTVNSIAAALKRAGPGTLITVTPGSYLPFSIGFSKNSPYNAPISGGAPGRPVTVRGIGQVRIIANGASDSISFAQQVKNGYFTFENLTIECGYRAGIMFYGTKGGASYVGYKFYDCDLLGGFDHLTGTGAKSKWGVWGSGLADFEFRGVKRRPVVCDTRSEHGFYLQNPTGNITIENVDAYRLGRTFCQFTARAKEGPPGVGTITIKNCRVSDCCIAGGDNFKGGSAFTFAGRLTGTILVQGNTYRAGFDPKFLKLTRPADPYGTGALVAWSAGEAPNGKLVLIDNDFELAAGCGDRPLVSLGGCEEVEITGKNRFVSGGKYAALELDPVREDGSLQNSPLGELSIAPESQFSGAVRRRGAPLGADELKSLGPAVAR